MSNYMAINVLCLSSLCATGGAWGGVGGGSFSGIFILYNAVK